MDEPQTKEAVLNSSSLNRILPPNQQIQVANSRVIPRLDCGGGALSPLSSNLKEGKAITTSLMVAYTFGKRHDNVLGAIRSLDCPNDFQLLNFKELEFITKNALGMEQRRPYYELTRDAFTILVMGFNGKKALKFKLAYIQEFNRMEAFIKEQQQKPQATGNRNTGHERSSYPARYHPWKECMPADQQI
jgi:Rha family phage regulatory protein